MIRYVDSSGWTWDVCEVARDLDDGDGAIAAPDSGMTTLAASPRARERDPRATLTDGPAELRPIPHADSARGSSGEDSDPFGDDAALYFLSRLGTRKLRHYPPSWHELPRTELEALCWSAEIV